MSSRADTLARLRALRQAGKTGFSSYEVKDAEDLYDTVDDEGYKKVVRSRLDEDDFVVDDNGAGYADDGREDWEDRQGGYNSQSEDDLPVKSKAGSYYSVQSKAMSLTSTSKAQTRRRFREAREDQKWHQQILQCRCYHNCTQSKGERYKRYLLATTDNLSQRGPSKMMPFLPTFSVPSTPVLPAIDHDQP